MAQEIFLGDIGHGCQATILLDSTSGETAEMRHLIIGELSCSIAATDKVRIVTPGGEEIKLTVDEYLEFEASFEPRIDVSRRLYEID